MIDKPTVSRSQQAYEELRAGVINGDLAPGAKLVIAELQERYNIGAIPLREALNRLSAERLVTKQDQRGFRVPPVDSDRYLELQSARIVVESTALRKAIAARTRAWEDDLVLAFHHLAKAGPDPDGPPGDNAWLLSDSWSESHGRFHSALIAACDNDWLLAFTGQLYEQSARYRMRTRQLTTMNPPARADIVDEHQAIMEAAVAGEADLAVARLVEHYRLSVEIVLGEPIALDEGVPEFVRRAAATSRVA